jgi:hypothetical protein
VKTGLDTIVRWRDCAKNGAQNCTFTALSRKRDQIPCANQFWPEVLTMGTFADFSTSKNLCRKNAQYRWCSHWDVDVRPYDCHYHCRLALHRLDDVYSSGVGRESMGIGSMISFGTASSISTQP